MMQKILVLFFICFSASCADPVVIPPDVLPKDKMTKVLADIQLIEASIQNDAMERSDSTKNIVYGYYQSVFKKHNITADQFRRSFDFYLDHLDLMDKMYDDVIIELSKRQAEESNK